MIVVGTHSHHMRVLYEFPKLWLNWFKNFMQPLKSQLVHPGTKMPTFWEGGSMHNEHNYLLAVKEKMNDDTLQESCRQFGICFVDTTLSVFQIGQFEDDTCCSKLCTLLVQYPPSQVTFIVVLDF